MLEARRSMLKANMGLSLIAYRFSFLIIPYGAGFEKNSPKGALFACRNLDGFRSGGRETGKEESG